jgi:hypothetical protein
MEAGRIEPKLKLNYEKKIKVSFMAVLNSVALLESNLKSQLIHNTAGMLEFMAFNLKDRATSLDSRTMKIKLN